MNKDIFKKEKMISSSKGIRADIHDETRKEIESLRKVNPNTETKKTHKLKKKNAIATAFVLSIAGWIGVGHVKDYNYQKAIDKHNDGTIMLVPPENLNFEEEERKEAAEYLAAAFAYSESDITESEKEKYADTIDNYVKTGKAIHLEQKVMARQLDIAKKIGDADSIENDYKDTSLTFYNEHEEARGFRISGVDGEYYPIEGLRFFENDVPKNLIISAKDYYKYSDTNWGNMDKDERVEVGVKLAKHTETMMNDHYVITNKGIERVNDEDFKDLAEKYNKKQRAKSSENNERVYKEYGLTPKVEPDSIKFDEARDF